VVALLVLVLVAMGAALIDAQEAALPRHAGVVVRHGDGRITYADVAFREDEITGIELLRRSGIEQVTIPFGGLGEGVCSLEGEGCPASECRRRLCQGGGANAPFWQYFRQDAPGDWRPLLLGAGATAVRDGDVDGWSWTGRDPGLPAVTAAEVARHAGADPGAPTAGGAGAGVPPPAVRTVYPPGVGPPTPAAGQGPIVYAAAGGLLVLLGGGALLAVRRGRHHGETT